MNDASEALLRLRPVSFRYRNEIHPERTPQFGLIAEEVEKVSGELVTRDSEGKVNSVRYEAVNAMLLNEFLKEHRKVEEQGSALESEATTISQLQSELAKQQEEMKAISARLKEQDAQIEKVSAGIGSSAPVPIEIVDSRSRSWMAPMPVMAAPADRAV